jgi:DNA-directed RNA polymerase subunit alpha
MTVKYGKFELPTKIKIDESTFARFIAEPFERGFGHTIGNALRRILLTSMESPAIISVKIEGVPHEYMAIEGVVEDMTHIVLNLKEALLRLLPKEEGRISREPKIISKVLDITGDMLDRNGGQYIVTLRDLFEGSNFDIVNPDHPVFTVTKPMMRKVDLRVAFGRGYVPSERHTIKDRVTDEIVIDTAFSPVRLVNYYVENTRVGQDTDFDRLIIEVTTDGRITPVEAFSFATQIGILHLGVFDSLKDDNLSFEEQGEELSTDKDALMQKLILRIDEIELSVRSANCLAGADIETIGELVIMPENDLLRFRNFGKKSLTEIKTKLEEMGLSLGMDLSRLGITRENVKQLMKEYLEQKTAKEV